MSHTLTGKEKYVFIDIPRSLNESINYGMIEMLKDGVIFDPKYNSRIIYFNSNVHVIIMSNQMPKDNAFSADRIKLHIL